MGVICTSVSRPHFNCVDLRHTWEEFSIVISFCCPIKELFVWHAHSLIDVRHTWAHLEKKKIYTLALMFQQSVMSYIRVAI